jgi:ABC-type transport system involved in multi-copper enzyme maturation permease subunit
MSTLTAPQQQGAGPGLVPWRRMAWVTWRQHRFALAGLAVLLGALAVYLWITGLGMHHAYATAAACHPATSDACVNEIDNFNTAYGNTTQTVATFVLAVPMLIGGFIGAPVLARELETGTFRYAWTLGVGRRRWTLAKLVPLAVTVTAMAALFSLLFSWYYQPMFTDGNSIPLDPSLFGLRGVGYAAWALAGFSIGAFLGLLIRRVVPAIAATLAVTLGLTFTTALYLRPHYLSPVLARNLANPSAGAWILNGWWTHGTTVISQSAMEQIENPLFQRFFASSLPKNTPSDQVKFYKGSTITQVTNYLTHHGYVQWTTYQPGSRFWPFQWIEGGWLLALSLLLIAATVWLVHRRAA